MTDERRVIVERVARKLTAMWAWLKGGTPAYPAYPAYLSLKVGFQLVRQGEAEVEEESEVIVYGGIRYIRSVVPEKINSISPEPDLHGKFFGQGDGIQVFLREDVYLRRRERGRE